MIKWDEDNILDIIENHHNTYLTMLLLVFTYLILTLKSFSKIKKSTRNEFEIVDLIKDYQLENIDSHMLSNSLV